MLLKIVLVSGPAHSQVKLSCQKLNGVGAGEVVLLLPQALFQTEALVSIYAPQPGLLQKGCKLISNERFKSKRIF